MTGKTGANPEEKQLFTYDNAGRLTRTEDTAEGGKCRIYGYAGPDGVNGNRTSLTVKPLTGSNACDSAATGTTASYAYDSADRLKSTTRGSVTETYAYDKLGRTVSPASPAGGPSVPATDAGGHGLSLQYYETDLVQQLVQNGRTIQIALDAGMRPRVRTTTGSVTSTVTSYYGGDSDEPIATKDGTTITREIGGLDGDLAAVKVGAAAAKKLSRSS